MGFAGLFALLFKGTENVISSDPLCKDGNVRFTTLPLQPLSDNVESGINTFNSDSFSLVSEARNAQVTFAVKLL